MDERIYFSGDPATDSPRRHLERVLARDTARRPSRRWTWIAGALAGGALWRLLQRRREPKRTS